ILCPFVRKKSPLCAGPQAALTLWPATSLIFGQLEDDMLSTMTEMERRMQSVNLACQYIDRTKRLTRGRQTEPARSEKSPPCTELGEKEQFELSLDVSPFSPEELTVKTAGRRLLVTEKREQKSDSGDGSFFHEYREWRREAELPEDVRPEDVLCSLSEDGRLLIQAPHLALPAAKERAVSISVTPAPGNEEGPSEPQSSSVNGEPEGGLSAPAEH
uniref:SHSP domain-containing protein n=1 Tax=Leptobrachium leishanense TaxID=445787 RepID=A0A8C5QBY6_9ANUR